MNENKIPAPDDRRWLHIQKRTEDRLENRTLVGAATLVALNSKIVWNSQQGFADHEQCIPLKPRALFRLASMTKPITAAATMIQVERGRLALLDPVSRYIPVFAHMQIGTLDGQGKIASVRPSTNPIRITDLLTHTSGLGQGAVGDIGFRAIYPGQGDRLSDLVPQFNRILLDFEPQTQTGYSPLLAFDTLAYLIELTSGMTFAEFLAMHLFEPVAIEDITFSPSEEQKARLVGMYAIDEKGFEPVDMHGLNFADLPNSYTSGGASLMGTLEDYYRFAQMLANLGELDGRRILSPTSVRQMQAPMLDSRLPGLEAGMNWGLAMRIITRDVGSGYPLRQGSYGWSGAYGTHFWIDPSLNLVALYGTNLTTAGGAGAITAREFEQDVMQTFR